MTLRTAILSLSLALVIAAPASAQCPNQDVVYVPTPQVVVDTMLKLGKVTQNDVLYDLGSGDGRIPITAAKNFGARGVGIDICIDRINEANAGAKAAGVTDKVKFLHQDLFTTDISQATIVTLYLLPQLNVKLIPKLNKELKPGTRIVSHQFQMNADGVERAPKETVKLETGQTVYLWTIPIQP